MIVQSKSYIVMVIDIVDLYVLIELDSFKLSVQA